MKIRLKMSKQRGSVLLIALFIMSLITVMTLEMLEKYQLSRQRTQLMLSAQKNDLSVASTVALAKKTLTEMTKNKDPSQLIDDPTPILLPELKLNGTTVSSTILDMQGRFNINNLIDESYRPIFLRLLKNISPPLSDDQANTILSSIVDWITPGLALTSLDHYYLTLHPSFRSPHHAMVSISECRMVKGMTPELYTQLAPYLSALPTVTPINIVNASALLLASLNARFNPVDFETIRNATETKEFLIKNGLSLNLITMQSDYFLLKTVIAQAQDEWVYDTLLNRSHSGIGTAVSVVWQSRGTE